MNVSSVVNHFPTANKGFITTLGSTISAGAVTVPLTSVSGLTNGTIFVGIIEPGQANEQEFTGTVDTAGVQITGVKWTDGTNVDHTAGVTIVDYVSATGQNMQTKGLLVEHNQDGTHGTMTADNLTVDGTLTQTGVATFTTHIDVNDSSTAIRDSSDNELLKFAKTASAVNELTITNAATGNGASLSATGGDANIDFNVVTKGTGKLKVNGNTISDGAFTVWTPTLTGWSANPSGGIYYYNLVGKMCTLTIAQPNNGTSNATTCTFTLPFTAVTRSGARWNAACEIVDNGVTQTAPGLATITSGATVVTITKDFGFNAFTASGNKRVIAVVITYEIA